jgi:hypothetical protein
MAWLWSATAMASLYGINITKDDNDGVNEPWYAKGNEDQEVEPRAATGQQYDMEAFCYDGKYLTMIGGYNPWNPPTGMEPGDLFLGTGPIKYGDTLDPQGDWYDNGETFRYDFGYDYVFKLNFTGPNPNTFNLYSINSETTYYKAIDNYGFGESNPWKYASGGTFLTTGSFTPITGLTDLALAEYGLTGGSHYAIKIDLASLNLLPADTDFMVHFTQHCGNDNIMGGARTPAQQEPPPTVPDGGATVALLGIALAGIGLLRRK